MSVGSPAANVNASPHKRKEPGASSSLVVQPQRSLSWTDASSSATSSTGPPLLTATIKLGDGDLVRFIAVGLGIEVTLLRDAVPPGLPDRQCVPFLRQQQTGDLGWSRADKFLLEEWQRKSLSRLQGPASHTSSAEFNAAIETVIDTYLEGTGIDSTSLHVTRRGTYFDIRLDGELPPTPQEDDVLKANLQSSLTALAGQQVDVIALENGSIIVQCWCPASELPSALVGIATLCGRDVLPFEDGKPSPRVANAWEVQAARESVERIRTLIVGTLIEGIRTRIGPLSLDETRQLDSLQRQLYSLQSALPERRADPEAVLAAVRWRGLELQYAAEELRADLEIVLVAVRQHGAALQFAAEKLRADGQVVLAAVQQGGFALQFASPELKADRNVVLAAVRQDSCALQYASATLRADREIVLIAVRQHGAALQHASEEMMDDCEVVLTAVAENAASVSLASARMKADREFMLLAMQQNGAALGFASDELRADREVILAAVRQDGRALASASEELRNDREIVLAAMRQNGLVAAMGLVPRELHEDQEVQELLETAMSRLRLRPS